MCSYDPGSVNALEGFLETLMGIRAELLEGTRNKPILKPTVQLLEATWVSEVVKILNHWQ